MVEGLELVLAVLGALFRQHPLLGRWQHALPRHHVCHIFGHVSEGHRVGAVSEAEQIVEALLRQTVNAGAGFAQEQVGALIVTSDPIFFARKIVVLAARYAERTPARMLASVIGGRR